MSFINPVEKLTEFFTVLKLPSELFISNNATSDAAFVWIFILPPKAAEPFVDVPTPLWIWILSIEDAKLLKQVVTDYVKIPSFESRNINLINYCNENFDKLLISFGRG